MSLINSSTLDDYIYNASTNAADTDATGTFLDLVLASRVELLGCRIVAHAL